MYYYIYCICMYSIACTEIEEAKSGVRETNNENSPDFFSLYFSSPSPLSQQPNSHILLSFFQVHTQSIFSATKQHSNNNNIQRARGRERLYQIDGLILDLVERDSLVTSHVCKLGNDGLEERERERKSLLCHKT